MNCEIRFTKSKDYEYICDIGTKNYPSSYYEGKDSFISKIKGCYEGCLVADIDGVVGYIISFPYFVGKPYPLDSFFEKEENTNCWYIHDVVVVKEFRNKGIATSLVKSILNRSDVFCLTAVMNAANFWQKFGFRNIKELDYYGSKANYMILLK